MAAKKPTKQPWKVIEPTRKPKPAHQLIKPKLIEPKRVTIRVTKAPTNYSPINIRDSINRKLGSTIIAKVATSQKDNFVITLLPNHQASEFINQKPR